jgi:adenylosuccinate lyase
MPSGVFDSTLLKHMWSTAELRAVFNDETRVQKWYDYEAALALAQAELGVIPHAAAVEIAAKAKVENVDLEAIAAEIRRTKHPLVPALRALPAICQGAHGEYLHFGPTTQDVLDTGMMLQIKQAHAVFVRDLQVIGGVLYRLAERYKDTPMAGRTHAVQALPITFGHKCAIWLAETGRNYQRLTQLQDRMFVGSMVGAVGTQASFGDHAFELDRKVMARLGLGVADISWQPARDRLTEYVGVLGLIGGGLAKIANEIILLAHTEIDELAEPFNEGKVGSSTMPHKRNPSTCEGIVAVGRTLGHTVALMHDALMQEHERDASAWRFEWKALPEACLMTGAILAQIKDVLAGLEVHPDKMRRNLDALGGFLLSERVMFALADKLGKQSAHEAVYDAAMRGFAQGKTFEQALMANPQVKAALGTAELNSLLDPTTYVGLAPAIVERVLAETRASGWIGSERFRAEADLTWPDGSAPQDPDLEF